MEKIDVEEAVQYLIRVEGLEVQEAKLLYAKRQKLKASAFCGPNKSYPADSAINVQKGFAKLSQFGHRINEAVRKRIHNRLLGRAKRYKIEHKGCRFCKEGKEVSETVDWFLKKHEKDFKPCETC